MQLQLLEQLPKRFKNLPIAPDSFSFVRPLMKQLKCESHASATPSILKRRYISQELSHKNISGRVGFSGAFSIDFGHILCIFRLL